jgi:hypothetical protein
MMAGLKGNPTLDAHFAILAWLIGCLVHHFLR